MIWGIFYQGSGLGNQLHRYIATKVKATDLNTDYAMLYNPDQSGKVEGFKGEFFLHQPQIREYTHDGEGYWEEKKVMDKGVDIRGYDPEFNFVEDNTVIDGEFQDERYWKHREKEVDGWLKVEPLDLPDDLCVIGFRGGEYAAFPDLFLNMNYWKEGVRRMREINPKMRFEVHTDDRMMARTFFPELNVIQDIGINWRSMRYAKHAIIANSSFYILPRWLNGGTTIAPRYWARHNTKVWALPQNYYDRFTYI